MENEPKREWQGETSSSQKWRFFREMMSSFSLEYRQIRPSVVFGTRRKAALRGEGFAWVPDLGSFLKLREVGVSPYLGFTLYLSVFQCFGWYEALNGRLIGPKTWDRIDTIYFGAKVQRIAILGVVWLVNHENCEINHALMRKRPGMAVNCGFTK